MAVSYGTSEIAEGLTELFLAARGNTTAQAYNPLRDSLFRGNQGAYDLYGDIGLAGSMGFIALAPLLDTRSRPTPSTATTVGGESGSIGAVTSEDEIIWNKIHGTAKNISATEVPATFQIDLDDRISYFNPQTGTNTLWTNANATEHFGEYIGRFGEESWSIGLRSQIMLESYSAALNEAMIDFSSLPPGPFFGVYGGWEIGVNTQTGVVYHALPLN